MAICCDQMRWIDKDTVLTVYAVKCCAGAKYFLQEGLSANLLHSLVLNCQLCFEGSDLLVQLCINQIMVLLVKLSSVCHFLIVTGKLLQNIVLAMLQVNVSHHSWVACS